MKYKYENLKEIWQFVNNNFSGYFISLQLPLVLKTVNKDKAEEYFKNFLSKFEKHLQGGSENWIKHPCIFIGFYENKFEQGTYHLHILGSFINPKTNDRIKFEKMYRAAEKANNIFMKRYKQKIDYDIQTVKNMPRTSRYCTKELIFKGFVDSDRITTSEILFDYHKKTKKRNTKARQKQKTINNSYERNSFKGTLSTKYSVQMIKHSKYRTFSKIKKHKPPAQELEQKALISNYNKIRIKEYANKATNY